MDEMPDMSEQSEQRQNPRRRNTRVIMIGAVLGATAVLIATALAILPPGGPGGDRPSPGAERGGEESEQEPQPYQLVFEANPGECLFWTEDDASDIRTVTCGEPHLFEVTGKVDLAQIQVDENGEVVPDDGGEGAPAAGPAAAPGAGTAPSDGVEPPAPPAPRFPYADEDAPFPTPEQWLELKDQQCVPLSRDYLDGRLDPHGRFSVNAFTPDRDTWNDGDRTMHCALQLTTISGGLYPITGRVAELEQADVHEPGVCLGINGANLADPVDCAEPHAQEIVSVIDLSDQFPDAYPGTDAQDEYLAPACREASTEYAGMPVVDKGVVPSWSTLAPESWEAGTRKVKCFVAQLLPDGSGYAPITGSVTGDITVGDQPAPPPTDTVRPGVPVPTEEPSVPAEPSGEPSDAVPPSGAPDQSGELDSEGN